MQPVFLITSEIYPFSKSGGLGDVLGALPSALHEAGAPTSVITPFYGRVSTSEYHLRLSITDMPVGYPWAPITADVYETDYHGMTVYFIDRGEYFDRRNYYNTHKGDYFDNAERFVFFCRAALALIRRLGTPPSVVHCHDWQTALLPAYVHFLRRANPFWAHTSTMLTIHNLAFQGRFSSRLFDGCGLPAEAWSMEGVEYFGDFNLLKGGIAYADAVTTVSPSYAREILTEKFGCGLDGILRKRELDLHGILNGADYNVWNPGDDYFLPCCYTAENLKGKRECKEALIRDLGLDEHLLNRPVLGFIGRFRGQKGIDLLNAIIPRLMELNVGVISLGEGKMEHEAQALDLMETYRGRVAAVVGYTEEMAHRIQAGADIFLMPSRYEPCGLTQMYALRYGTPPVATAVGGLCDTIEAWPSPNATGFIFMNSTPGELYAAAKNAVDFWTADSDAWQGMVERAMTRAFTWERAAGEYLQLYAKLERERF